MTTSAEPRIGIRFKSLTLIHNRESDLFEIVEPEDPPGDIQGIAASVNMQWAMYLSDPADGDPVVAFVRRHAQAMRLEPIIENVEGPDEGAVQ